MSEESEEDERYEEDFDEENWNPEDFEEKPDW